MQDNETNKNLMACWKAQISKQLKGFFEGFGFVFKVKQVPSTGKLTEEVNALVTSDLSEFQSIFIFVLSHGSYDRICDVEGRSKEIQSLRKSLTDFHFFLNKSKVLVIEGCQFYKVHYAITFRMVGKKEKRKKAFYRISYSFLKISHQL